MNYTGHIYKFTTKLEHKGKTKYYSQSLLQIHGFDAVTALEKIGIKENKTQSEFFPPYVKKIKKGDIVSSFIRGVFDGDGSILFDKKRNSMCFQIVGSYQLLKDIQKYLIHYCKIKKTKLTRNIKSTNHYALRYRGNLQVPKIMSWIYKYSQDHNRMERKFKGFRKIQEVIKKCVE